MERLNIYSINHGNFMTAMLYIPCHTDIRTIYLVPRAELTHPVPTHRQSNPLLSFCGSNRPSTPKNNFRSRTTDSQFSLSAQPYPNTSLPTSPLLPFNAAQHIVTMGAAKESTHPPCAISVSKICAHCSAMSSGVVFSVGVSGEVRSAVYTAPVEVSATRQMPYPGEPALPRAGSEYIWILLGGRKFVKTFLAEVARRVVICAGSLVEVAMPLMAVIR